MRKLTRLALFSMIPVVLFGARLTLRNGSVVDGRLVSSSEQRIVFEDTNGVQRTFNTNEVPSLDFNAPAYSSRENDATASRDRMDDRSGPVWRTLPAGTTLSVRTNETTNADSANEGRTYDASIQEDILDASGTVMIPRDSRAYLVVRGVNEGGTFTSGNLVLDLDSVEVRGHRYAVSTEDLERGNNQGIGANRRTGEMVGGGAALGTLLGAIAGGGKGAVIGAIAGAAAGGSVQVLTKGKQIRVPAETVLNFRLDQPLSLRERR